MSEVMSLSVEHEILKELNEDQKNAVCDISNPCLVLAGAGTGKTKVLTHKVAYVLAVDPEVKPSQIVLLTFTKTAAEEMIKRVKSLTRRFDGIMGGTFHSFAYQELKKTIYKQNKKLYVLDESDQERIFKIILETNKNDRFKTYISKKDDFMLIAQVTADIAAKIYNYYVESGERLVDVYLNLAFSNKIDDKSFIVQYENIEIDLTQFIEEDKSNVDIANDLLEGVFYDIYNAYKEYKKEKNLLDFSDLLRDFYQALKNGKIKPDIKYLFVDEYQDVSNLQANIVFELAKICENRVTVVGDDAQAIYGFRASNYKNILSFKELMPGCKVYKVVQNYRSTQEILNLANHVLNNNARYLAANPDLKKYLFSEYNGEMPFIFELSYSGPVTSPLYNDSVANIVLRELKRHNVSPENAAVLCRSAYMLDRLEVSFMKKRVQYYKMGGVSIFERGYVKDFMALISFIYELPNSEISFYRIVEHISGVGEKTAHRMYQELVKYGNYDFEAVESFLKSSRSIKNSDAASRFIKRLSEIYLTQKNQLEPISRILEHIRLFYFSEMYPNLIDSMQMKIIDNIVEEIIEVGDINQFLENIYFRDSYKNTGNGLIISTIHAAKGLEWEAVFLVNLFDYAFPTKNALTITRQKYRVEAIDEELRLLYVALTRAKKLLYIIKPLQNPSMFLQDLDGGMVNRIII